MYKKLLLNSFLISFQYRVFGLRIFTATYQNDQNTKYVEIIETP
jgi:hypothetical protein